MYGSTVHYGNDNSLCSTESVASIIEDDNPRLLRPDLVDRVRKIPLHNICYVRRQSPKRMECINCTFEEEEASVDRLNLEDYH